MEKKLPYNTSTVKSLKIMWSIFMDFINLTGSWGRYFLYSLVLTCTKDNTL